MAYPAGAIWEIRTSATAGNVNGGAFNAARGGVDYSQQDTAQLNGTDLTCTAGSTTVTSATGGFTSQMVGNYIHLTALTGTGALVGWYEIVTYTDGNNVVLDRTPTNGVNNITAGTFYVGGAALLGTTLDDDMFEAVIAGNIFYIKSGTYTLSESIAASYNASVTNGVFVIGYNTTRDDNPTGDNRPLLAFGSLSLTLGQFWQLRNIRVTGTSANLVTLARGVNIVNSSVINDSTTASRVSVNHASGVNDVCMILLEAACYRGSAYFQGNGSGLFMFACLLRDSTFCYSISAVGQVVYMFGCLIVGGRTRGLSSSSSTNYLRVWSCTFYGAESKLGVGAYHTNGNSDIYINCVFYGLDTGIELGTDDNTTFVGWCDFYNCTAEVTNCDKSTFANIALDPGFGITERSGSTATTTSGNHLVQTGATFQTWNVAAGDMLCLESGTGITAGWYTIASVDSETQVTTNETLSANATADKVWLIRQGNDFNVGANMAAKGILGSIGEMTGYMDLGAVQRQASSGGGNANVLRGSTVAAR